MGGRILLKLNINQTPIANKYREGKMKRTLKKELKVPEIAEREDIELCVNFINLFINIIYLYFINLY